MNARRRSTLSILAGLALVLAMPLLAQAALADEAAAAGSLNWGIKESLREYVGEEGVSAGEGASIEEDGTYRFELVEATYDPETTTTSALYSGLVHMLKYETSTGEHLLDFRISDPRVEISPDEQVLYGHVESRPLRFSEPAGELRDYGEIPLATLDVDPATVTADEGVTAWHGIETFLTAEFNEALGSSYAAGVRIDPLAFSYEGEGGKPDLGDPEWTPEGAPLLEEVATGDASSFVGFKAHLDAANGILYLIDPQTSGAIRAFDSETLEALGGPYLPPNAGNRLKGKSAFDPDSGSVVTASMGTRETSGGAPGADGDIVASRWDEGGGEWVSEVIADPLEMSGLSREPMEFRRGLTWMVYDPVGDRLVAMLAGSELQYPDVAERFRLVTWTRQAPGSWAEERHVVEQPEPTNPSWNEGQSGGYTGWLGASTDSFPNPRAAVAGDGSIVVSRDSTDAYGEEGNQPQALLRLNLSGGAVETEGIASTEAYQSVVPDSTGRLWAALQPANFENVIRPLDLEGGEFAPGPPTTTPVNGAAALGFSIDPVEDSLNAIDPLVPALDVLRGGEEIAELPLESGFYASFVLGGTADGGSYISQVSIGSSVDTTLRRIEKVGESPSIATQPADSTVTVEPGGSAGATFEVAASGDPAPGIQWQAKEPGEARFADLEGETSPDLAVEATAADNGTQYRAVISNAAGQLATDVATLTVEGAPALSSQPHSTTVTEGTEALFGLVASGNPEPEITWQRRVDGFWRDIDPEDDNFVVNGPSLTVRFTNTEQTGSLFRAKLVNSVGTTFSEPAILTVRPRVSIPPEGLDLEDVTLDWTGNEEMQKAPPVGGSNYFSAGASDGGESTYSADEGDVRVLRVAPGGGESLATWDTRAAHVGAGEQLVRLYGGEARIEADGSASVAWEGTFSVNFYGGLVPFTFVDPELEVDETGTGKLSAEMVGCASSQENPDVCEPFAARPGVTVATFSGVEIDPAGEVEIEPDYEGVEVTAPAGAAPQDRESAGWGAWPQSFVDFQGMTGLSAYWYSSGGSFDPYKAPFPFLVDFSGATPPDDEPDGGGDSGEDDSSPLDVPQDAEEVVRTARWPVLRRIPARRATVRGNGVVTVLRIGCRGPVGCTVRTRAATRVTVGGRAYRARVLAPHALRPGTWGAVRLRLARGAVAALRGKRVRARVWVGVRSGERRLMRPVTAVLRGPRARGGAGRGVRRVAVRRTVASAGAVPVAALRCRGTRPCAVRAPRVVSTRASGGRLAARVQTPRRVAPGRLARVRLRLGAGALRRLGDGAAVLRVPVTLRAGKRASVHVFVVRLSRRSGGEDGGEGGRDDGGGPGGGGSPESAPISGEPPVLERPDSAVDVEGVEISWYPRDSWIRYASSGTGAGDGILFSGGATGIESKASACPDRPSTSDALLPYEVEFDARESWFDPESGRAGIYGEGDVTFRWKAHTIDLTASDPEIEIDGSDSRAIFRFQGSEGTPYPDERADLVSLDLGGAPSVSGDTYSYDLMRGTLTENGVNVFAGFYTPPDNDEFGCVSVSFEVS